MKKGGKKSSRRYNGSEHLIYKQRWFIFGIVFLVYLFVVLYFALLGKSYTTFMNPYYDFVLLLIPFLASLYFVLRVDSPMYVRGGVIGVLVTSALSLLPFLLIVVSLFLSQSVESVSIVTLFLVMGLWALFFGCWLFLILGAFLGSLIGYFSYVLKE